MAAAEDAPDATRQRLKALNGVRAIACLLVLINHANALGWFPPGKLLPYTGVSIFFLLSGFLIAYHHLPGRLSLRYWLGFGWRRLFRVFPAYAAAVLGCYLIYRFDPKAASWLGHFNERITLLHLSFQHGWITFWTMAVEMRFYLCVPLVGLGLLWLPPRLQFPALLAFAAGWLLLGPTAEVSLRKASPFFGFLGFFGAGMAAGLYRQQTPACSAAASKQWDIISWAALLGFSVFLALMPMSGQPDDRIIWQHDAIVAPTLALLMLGVTCNDGLLARLLRTRPLALLARLSFCLYLVHIPVFHLIKQVTPALPQVARLPTAWLALFIAASLLYLLVEKPCARLNRRRAL